VGVQISLRQEVVNTTRSLGGSEPPDHSTSSHLRFVVCVASSIYPDPPVDRTPLTPSQSMMRTRTQTNKPNTQLVLLQYVLHGSFPRWGTEEGDADNRTVLRQLLPVDYCRIHQSRRRSGANTIRRRRRDETFGQYRHRVAVLDGPRLWGSTSSIVLATRRRRPFYILPLCDPASGTVKLRVSHEQGKKVHVENVNWVIEPDTQLVSGIQSCSSSIERIRHACVAPELCKTGKGVVPPTRFRRSCHASVRGRTN
jgi:hypothetical protein